jgi:hypothetical protein
MLQDHIRMIECVDIRWNTSTNPNRLGRASRRRQVVPVRRDMRRALATGILANWNVREESIRVDRGRSAPSPAEEALFALVVALMSSSFRVESYFIDRLPCLSLAGHRYPRHSALPNG